MIDRSNESESKIKMRLLESHIKTAKAVVDATERRRQSERLDAIDFRATKKPVEDDFDVIVERFAKQMPDHNGDIGTPHKVYDTLAILRRNRSITDDHMKAGRTFEETFKIANIDPLRSFSLQRMSASTGASLRDVTSDQRRIIIRTLDALGGAAGMTAQAPSSLWYILGFGFTIKEWATRCQFGYGASLSSRTAKTIFVSALSSLCDLWFTGDALKGQVIRAHDRHRLNVAKKDIDVNDDKAHNESRLVVVPDEGIRVIHEGGTLTLDGDTTCRMPK